MTIKPDAGRDAGPWWKRVLWFALIWIVSLTALSAVAYAIRAAIMP